MQYPPVNFRLLRQLLNTARLDDELAESGKSRGYALRQMIAQLDMYAPSEQRDGLRALVDLALEHRSVLNAVGTALEHWAFESATNQQRASAKGLIRSKINSSKGGKAPRIQKQIAHDEWVAAMDKMLERNKHRTPADMGRSISELPDVDAKPDTIARYLRNVLKTR